MRHSVRHRRGYGAAVRCALLFALAAASPAQASDAGTRIVNTATLRYEVDGTARTTASNAVTLLVAERLDVTLARTTADAVARGTAVAIPVLLTNTGNGHEAFILQTRGTGNAPTIVAVDADGDGRFDPTRDRVLTGGTTPEIVAGATLALLVVVDTSGTTDGSALTILTHAATGSGVPGTTIAEAGDGGGDAVVGPTGAAASIRVPVAGGSLPTLAKTQDVLAPDGSTRPVKGAIVTYVLQASFAAAAEDARVDDPIPAGTLFVPGSLSLDGTALADAAAGSAIHVPLGPVPAGASHRIQFQVQIQ